MSSTTEKMKLKEGCCVLGRSTGTTWWLVVLVIMVTTSSILVCGCPTDCVCKWKGGKQWVECLNRNLRTFPPTIDIGTQVLDMTGNSFETLPPDHFMRSGLINLQKIFLSKCRLSHINSRAFRGLSNLVELDLSENLLHEVPTQSFPDCQGLMRLVLSGNSIGIVQRRAFSSLQALATLELSRAGVELIEHGAFEGLYSLEWLKLDGNRLKRLSGLTVLPLSLKGMALEDNPWECDCQLLELRIWLGERNVANQVDPRCNGPERLANQTIRTLDQEHFACFPQLSPTTMYQKIGEGKNVSLQCKVTSVPESSLEWLFNGQPLSNSSLNLLVETTTSPSSMSSLGPTPPIIMTTSSTSTTSTHPLPLMNPVEKKSELLILNATSEENGTFLCMAKNPAGVALANFTLRVLTKYDTEYYYGGHGGVGDYTMSGLGFAQFPQLVADYPNLFIILLSTVAVIGVVIVVFSIAFVLCRCTRSIKRRRGVTSTQRRDGGDGIEKNPSGGGGQGLGGGDPVRGNGSVVSVCGSGKLDSRISDGTLSSVVTGKKSKSNNSSSVFLLLSPSDDGMGDSNPDLIEGVTGGGGHNNNAKRVEGDGLDSNYHHYNHNNHPHQEPHPQYNNTPPSSSSTHTQTVTTTSLSPHLVQHHHHLLVPNNSNASSTSGSGHMVGTLVRNRNTNHHPTNTNLYSTLPHGFSTRNSNGGVGVTLWPMDYGLPSNYDLSKYPKEYINPYEPQYPMNMNPHPHVMNSTTMNMNPAIIYTTTSTNTSDSTSGYPNFDTYVPLPLITSGESYSCSCGPSNPTAATTMQKTKTASTSTSTSPEKHSSESCSSTKEKVNGESSSSNSTKHNLVTRPKVQFSTTTSSIINESPDEGYEDGGTEI